MMYGQLCTEFYDVDKKLASQEEVDFYKQIFNKGDQILEPMCGSGRLLIPLLQEGFSIDGVDSSHAMLTSCRVRAEKFGLNPKLFESKLENIHFDHAYDGIIIPLGSFQLLYPRETAFNILKKFKTALKPKGRLAMDLFIPWDALWKNNEEEDSTRTVKISDRETITLQTHSQANKYMQLIEYDSIYTKLVNGECVAREKEHMFLCWYYSFEMELILEKFGFKNIKHKDRYLNHENIMTFIAAANDD